MRHHNSDQRKCPECQYCKAAAEFREAGTDEPLPACKQCLRTKQRGGSRWTA